MSKHSNIIYVEGECILAELYEIVSQNYLQVNSCSVAFLNDRDYFTFRKDGRVDYHIIYVYSGVYHVVLNGKSTFVEKGNIIVFLPGERQQYAYKKSDFSVHCYIHFTGKECERLMSYFSKDDNRIFNVGVDDDIKNLYQNIAFELNIKREGYSDLCAGYFLQLLTLFKRKLINANTQRKTIIPDVCSYMTETLDRFITVSDYAKHFNLSANRFGHLFKEITGQTPQEYLITLRINKAKYYLKHTNLSIGEISIELGFSSSNYFSRIFKKRVGMTPSEYIRHHHNSEYIRHHHKLCE